MLYVYLQCSKHAHIQVFITSTHIWTDRTWCLMASRSFCNSSFSFFSWSLSRLVVSSCEERCATWVLWDNSLLFPSCSSRLARSRASIRAWAPWNCWLSSCLECSDSLSASAIVFMWSSTSTLLSCEQCTVPVSHDDISVVVSTYNNLTPSANDTRHTHPTIQSHKQLP